MSLRKGRAARHTILLVGEGTTDSAFLKHIKSLYISRGSGVSATVRNARGKGPDHVVDYAIRQRLNTAYDRVAALLDADLEMSPSAHRRARSKKVQIIKAEPCLEGLLLKILGEYVPATSADCKARVGATLPARLTAPEDYQEKFPKHFLNERRDDVPELGILLDYLLFNELRKE